MFISIERCYVDRILQFHYAVDMKTKLFNFINMYSCRKLEKNIRHQLKGPKNVCIFHTSTRCRILKLFYCIFPHRITRKLSLVFLVHCNNSPYEKLVVQVTMRPASKNGLVGIFVENEFCSAEFHFIADEIVGILQSRETAVDKTFKGC